jgi:hypothetical protein
VKKFLAIIFILFPAMASSVLAQDIPPLKTRRSIPLQDVSGRLDHLAIDQKNRRLFIAAFDHNSVEVIDPLLGKCWGQITGLHHPQGLLYLADLNKLYVTNASGALDIYDGQSFMLVDRIVFPADADAVLFDEARHLVYVSHGDAIAVLDALTEEKKADIQLPGHPEGMALEKQGARLFANIPSAHAIVVVDRQKKRIQTTWPLKDMEGNFPLGLDEARHRLFIGVRNPALLLVLDTETGKRIAEVAAAADCDDLFFDATRRRIYMSCGEGFLFVFEQADADHYRIIAKVRTSPGSRTSLFTAEDSSFYLAMPSQDSLAAQILVFTAE